MNDQYFFADVDLPFHVWVRERTAQGHRWVLRAAPQAAEAGDGEVEAGTTDLLAAQRSLPADANRRAA